MNAELAGYWDSQEQRSAYGPKIPDDHELLTQDITDLATRYGRYGYRRVTALLRDRGWHVNHKRVERIWRREGLKVPKKQPKRGRLWLNDGSCIRLRAEGPNHVWAYDFVSCRTEDGRAVRLLTVIDEYTRECMAIQAARRIRSDDVMHTLTSLFSSTAFQSTSGRTTVRSSLRRRFGTGCRVSVYGSCLSSQGVRGKTATTRASMENSGMNC